MLLHDKLKPYRLILASQSPRRQQLLAESGLPYEPAPRYDCQEVYPATLAATQVPRYLSQLKSRAYPRPLAENEILLTADTVVILNGEVLGKPEDREDAIRMLERLSGHRHTVVTGVTLRTARRRRSFSVRSNVWFRALTREEIVITWTTSIRWTRPAATAFRSGSAMPPSSASTARSSTSWGCRSNASIPNSINSFNQ